MRKLLVFILLALVALAGCATNPVTGKNELSLISEAQELNIGKQQYAPMRQAEGGDYVVDPEVGAYVNRVGQRLASVSDRRLPYEFKVLNNSVPNAWALPGGKICINRGLLTELQSESELAAVLSHEIVHAAAKHGAQGMQRGMLLQGAVMAATIAVASQNADYTNVAQLGASIGAQLINQKYGRDDEREADVYGMQYMARAGYDPQGAVVLQKTFVTLSEKRQQNWLSGLFASHPPSPERVANNIKTAAELPRGGEIGRNRYRRKMAHLVKTKPAYESYHKAQKALADGNTAEAIRLVNQAIAVEPREGHFYSLLGDIEQKNKRYNTALKHYDKAIRLNDNFFYYHLQSGIVHERLGRNTASKRRLERSLELLPTANAFNSLGNIAREEGRFVEAKQYFTKAAGHRSAAGKAAFGSLVDIDLADNPDKYIELRTGVDKAGQIIVLINNPTPRNITGLVIALQYPDAKGKLRQVQRQLKGQLQAGKQTQVNLGIRIDPEQARQVRSKIVAARVAN
jgi:predicted Zn-dependent protease